jgi:hypothetical protein
MSAEVLAVKYIKDAMVNAYEIKREFDSLDEKSKINHLENERHKDHAKIRELEDTIQNLIRAAVVQNSIEEEAPYIYKISDGKRGARGCLYCYENKGKFFTMKDNQNVLTATISIRDQTMRRGETSPTTILAVAWGGWRDSESYTFLSLIRSLSL